VVLPNRSCVLLLLTCYCRFDHPTFYREVRRVLKPDGCLAAWTYGLPTLCNKEHPANTVLWGLYDDVLGSYWAAGRRHVEAAYIGIEPVMGTDFGSVKRLSFDTTRTACVDDVVSHRRRARQQLFSRSPHSCRTLRQLACAATSLVSMQTKWHKAYRPGAVCAAAPCTCA
jgi:SAM-dependent methyltransferase